MEVWISCPDCGQKVLSARLKPQALLRAHREVCPLRVIEVTPRAPKPPVEGQEAGDEVGAASP
jgi:hypothetical protein